MNHEIDAENEEGTVEDAAEETSAKNTSEEEASTEESSVDQDLLDRLELIKSQPLQQQAESFEQLYQQLRQDVE